MNSIKSKSEVKNIDFFYGKSVTDLINLRVYIKKIYFKFRISKGSCYVFDKFYAEHLNKNLKSYHLGEEVKSESYSWGSDACGHPNRGREYFYKQFYPYFTIDYSSDDGYYQSFYITPEVDKVKYPKFDSLKGSAPTILDLIVYIIKDYAEYIEDIEFLFNKNISISDYLDIMHPKYRLETYKELGMEFFSDYKSALEYSKENAPCSIQIDKDIYVVQQQL